MNDADLDRLLEALAGHYFGKYRGRVVDNTDPLKRGSVQVVVPEVMGEKALWALPCAPYAGSKIGFFAIPPVGSSVWVEFEAGQANFPVWVGAFWQDGEIEDADASPKVVFLRTPGATIRIEDSGTLEIETQGGAKITMTGTEITLEAGSIKHTGGINSVTLTDSGFDALNGALTVM